MKAKCSCKMCSKTYSVEIGIDGRPIHNRCTGCRKKVKRMRNALPMFRVIK